MDAFRSWIARGLASVVAGISTWIAETIGPAWALGEDERTATVAFLVTIALAAYSAAHRLINQWVNPADEAAPTKVPK